MKKIIKNGMLCTESGVYEADLLLEEGVIREIGTDLQDSGAEVVDAKGKYVLPGAVDIHTHMDLDVGIARVIDDFYTGTIAAACGGTTSIVDHMAFGPQNCSLWHQVKEYHRLADGNAVVDYGFHGVFQHVNPQVLEEMGEIAKEEGITSFKVYMTYGYGLGDSDLMQILTRAKQDGILIASHCENDGIVNYWREKFVKEGHTQAKYHPISRPAEAEAEAVNRFLYLAESAGEAPVYVVHLSSKQGLMEVRRARRRGQKHFGVETCPQYLLMDDSLYELPGFESAKYVCAPPLRKKEDQDCLWKGLADGTIQTVSTDHCSFTTEQKKLGEGDFTKIPGGMPGAETRGTLIYTYGVDKGRITKEDMCRVLSENPAKLYGLYPRKGVIAPGSDADLVIMRTGVEDVITAKDQVQNVDYAPFEGTKVTGRVESVFLRGLQAVKDGKVVEEKKGEFLKRGKYAL